VYRLTEQYKLYLNFINEKKIYCAHYHLLYEMVKMFSISQICKNRITDGLQGTFTGTLVGNKFRRSSFKK